MDMTFKTIVVKVHYLSTNNYVMVTWKYIKCLWCIKWL